jgi:hypothetical protein
LVERCRRMLAEGQSARRPREALKFDALIALAGLNDYFP